MTRDVRPWDLFNKNMERLSPALAKKRLDVCTTCPRFVKFTKQCRECGCIMPAKVKLADATCPLSKWAKMPAPPFDRELSDEEIETFFDN